MFNKIQETLKKLSNDEKEQEAYIMFGLISTLLFFAIIGLLTERTLACLF